MGELPAPYVSLFDALRGHGFVDANFHGDPWRGPNWFKLSRGDLAVRASLCGDEWILELASRAWGGGWYDAAVVRAAMDHTSVAGPDDANVLARFVLDNLDSRIVTTVPDIARLRDDLDRLTDLRRNAQRGLLP